MIDFTEAQCKNGEAKDTQATRENEQEDLECSGDAEDIDTSKKTTQQTIWNKQR